MKQIGEILKVGSATLSASSSIDVSQSRKMALSTLSTTILDAMDVMARGEMIPLDLAKSVVGEGIPPEEPCTDEHFNQCFRVLAASLPKRASDEISGKLMFAAYRNKLRGYPKGAINYLSDCVLSRCEWFPTIKECLGILDSYNRSDRAIQAFRSAECVVRRDRQEHFDDAMHRLACGEFTQEQIDALPESWKKVGETRSYLWLLPDGSYIARIKKGGERVPFPNGGTEE